MPLYISRYKRHAEVRAVRTTVSEFPYFRLIGPINDFSGLFEKVKIRSIGNLRLRAVRIPLPLALRRSHGLPYVGNRHFYPLWGHAEYPRIASGNQFFGPFAHAVLSSAALSAFASRIRAPATAIRAASSGLVPRALSTTPAT